MALNAAGPSSRLEETPYQNDEVRHTMIISNDLIVAGPFLRV